MPLLESTTVVEFSSLFPLSMLQLFEQTLVIDDAGGPASFPVVNVN